MEKTRRGYRMKMKTRTKIIDVMTNPENDGLTQKEVATLVGIGVCTLRDYLTLHVWQEIKYKRLNVIKEQLCRVDDAVFIKAIRGDIAAAKLIYARWQELHHQQSNTDVLLTNLDTLNSEITKLNKEISRYESPHSTEKSPQKPT